MATKDSRAEKRTDRPYSIDDSRARVRPRHILLGVDICGAHHIYQTVTETVHIVREDGGRGRRLLDAGDVDDYMDAVRDAHGWAHERYGQSAADLLVEALE